MKERRSQVVAATALSLAASLSAQTTWTDGNSLEGRWTHAMAYDAARGRVVVFGGHSVTGFDLGDLWEWSGAGWLHLSSEVKGPKARREPALAHDRVRNRLVLFGGTVGGAETWEWDGSTWQQFSPTQVPPAREKHAMVYDEARQRTVLFGGFGQVFGSGDLNDTWEWDGTNWLQRAPAQSPPRMSDHAMAYDAARQRVVLLGNVQTWEWDGNNWSQKFPSQTPISIGHCMAYDRARQRVLVYGGGGATTQVGGTWEWDGSQWALQTPATTPPPLAASALAYDEVTQRVVLFGGLDNTRTKIADTWEWDGNTWSRVEALRGSYAPRPLVNAAMAADRAGTLVIFGGQFQGVPVAETFTYRNRTWSRLAPAVEPLPTYDHAMANDPLRNRVVLFGGIHQLEPATSVDTSPRSASTWEWDGTAWQKVIVAGPSARGRSAMEYDYISSRVLLFGGETDNGVVGDTWTYNGTSWLQSGPAVVPSARAGHAMASDPVRGRIVLFGGRDGNRTLLNDTWEWDGSAWTQRQPAIAPPARSGHTLTYDYGRNRVVLAFGEEATGTAADVWEWDGSTWTPMALRVPTAVRRGHVAASSSVAGALVIFGGESGSVDGEYRDTWLYRGGEVTAFGTGCGAFGSTPTLDLPYAQSPTIGMTLGLLASSLQPGPSAGVVMFGVSNAHIGGVGLPLSLASFGMPSCTLLQSADLALPFRGSNGRGLWAARLPATRSLVGAAFYSQAFELVPRANQAGVLASNALRLVVGRH